MVLTVCQVLAVFVLLNVLFNRRWWEMRRRTAEAQQRARKKRPKWMNWIFYIAMGNFYTWLILNGIYDNPEWMAGVVKFALIIFFAGLLMISIHGVVTDD